MGPNGTPRDKDQGIGEEEKLTKRKLSNNMFKIVRRHLELGPTKENELDGKKY